MMIDEYSDDLTAVSYRIITNNEFQTNNLRGITIKEEVDNVTTTETYPDNFKHYTVVSYGPIKVRVSTRSTPTLQSGRRSKFYPLEGEAARKREMRRAKNRRTAQMLKERQIRIENELATELGDLEVKGKDLLEEINNLKLYKTFLENRYKKKELNENEIHVTSSFEKHGIKQINIDTTIKSEPESSNIETCPSSPKWQLLFSI
ncbi:hypothetical protein I4U23_003162 [Adineta vaga]|nr:hypothetical protein I4U23_003162 [Adineta vaga]